MIKEEEACDQSFSNRDSVWVKGKAEVWCVEGCVHTLFSGPSAAELPGIWKERSGKSTPWSEWYICKI